MIRRRDRWVLNVAVFFGIAAIFLAILAGRVCGWAKGLFWKRRMIHG